MYFSALPIRSEDRTITRIKKLIKIEMPLRSRRFLMELMKGMEQYFFNGIFYIFSFTFSLPSKVRIIMKIYILL